VRSFAAIMTGRRGRYLGQWMISDVAIGERALQSFVTGCALTRTPSPPG
jgi:hypothetical protein